ncbi:MAG: hypothetical protein KGS00_06830 [Alphaproteobacteria bacterium]|nr:hypothetical protein [Alphaproteobacteria bacterium]
MRKALSALACIAILAMPASALTVETRFSTAFQEKLEKDYGVREADGLARALKQDVEKALSKIETTADRVVLTIEDAQPNRPTMKQTSDKPGLDSIRSVSLGGAHVSGIVYDPQGRQIASLDYDWFETDLSNAVPGGVWSDARRAFSRYASRLAKDLTGARTGG